jgi:hypothetical protein
MTSLFEKELQKLNHQVEESNRWLKRIYRELGGDEDQDDNEPKKKKLYKIVAPPKQRMRLVNEWEQFKEDKIMEGFFKVSQLYLPPIANVRRSDAFCRLNSVEMVFVIYRDISDINEWIGGRRATDVYFLPYDQDTLKHRKQYFQRFVKILEILSEKRPPVL